MATILEIRVVEGYRGRRTKEQYIESGNYSADDPALHGLADFLVSTGRAVIVRQAVVPTETAQEEAAAVETPAEESPKEPKPKKGGNS